MARKHVAAIGRMPDVEIAIVAGGDPSDTADSAEELAIHDWTLDLDDREFFDAIAQGREPNASVGQALETMKVLDWIDSTISRP